MRIFKNRFDGKVENGGDTIGQIERRIMFVGLDGDNGLPRDVEAGGQIGLGQTGLSAQVFQAVLHLLPRMKGEARPKQAQNMG